MSYKRFLPLLYLCLLVACFACRQAPEEQVVNTDGWHRPVENPVFTTDFGNNHDAIILVDSSQTPRKYYLLLSGWQCDKTENGKPLTYLWRTTDFSWESANWELIDPNYNIGCQYEYDDAVWIDGTCYIYEDGLVYTHSGALEDASGKWKVAGSFPKEKCDDVGVFYENGIFHLFGEFGACDIKNDGAAISHFVSTTGIGDWQLVDSLVINPNTDGSGKIGVGDPTIFKYKNAYYILCDMETATEPYFITMWKADSLNAKFTRTTINLTARNNEVEHWDNYCIQDAEVIYLPEKKTWVMACNMRDKDGNPGPLSKFPYLRKFSRVVGFFYATDPAE